MKNDCKKLEAICSLCRGLSVRGTIKRGPEPFAFPRTVLFLTLIFLVFSCFSWVQAVDVTYTYDKLNRLTKVIYSDGTYIEYTYDAVGNRLSETIGSGTTVSCIEWNDVISKYNSYVSGSAQWSEVIACYNAYVSPSKAEAKYPHFPK